MAVAYLALGSNLGDRLERLRAAAVALDRDEVRIVSRSSVFETPAVTPDPQPPYLNAALRVATTLGARALLDHCLAIEMTLGRVRPQGRSGAARAIDIDLLLHGSTQVDEPGLLVPHPRLLERAFVRAPLAEVAEPGLCHPVTGERLDRFRAPAEIHRLAATL